MLNTTLKVGDDAVLGRMLDGQFYPISFNSRHNKEHPCRGKVLKIGRKLIHLQGNEPTPWKVQPYDPTLEEQTGVAVPVALAKELYRKTFAHFNDTRPEVAAYIEQL